MKFHTIDQKLDAYCDDVNMTTDNLGDLEKISDEVQKFEVVSGAILSRDKKCKVMGFGKWSNKTDWPLAWLKPVKSLKVFGIFLADSYSEIQRLNWEHRFQKFSDVIYSWSSRFLDILQQRVEVIRMFALSRVYYVLRIRPSVVKKFEALMGNFLWKFSGKILRIPIDEIKNDKLCGGLNLPCLASMADSLLASQCIRMSRSGDRKSLGHINFW